MIGLLRVLGQNRMLMEELQLLMEESSESLVKILTQSREQSLIISELKQTVCTLKTENSELTQEIVRLQDHSKSQTLLLRGDCESMALNLAHKEDELKSMQRHCTSLARQKVLLEIDTENMAAALKEQDIEMERMYNQFDFERDYLREEVFDIRLVDPSRATVESGTETTPRDDSTAGATARRQKQLSFTLRADAGTQLSTPDPPGRPPSGRAEDARLERLLRAACRVVDLRRAHTHALTALRRWSHYVYTRQAAFSRRECAQQQPEHAALTLAAAAAAASATLTPPPCKADAEARAAVRSVETFVDLDLQFGWAGRLNEIMAISLSELQELVCRQNLQIVNLEVRVRSDAQLPARSRAPGLLECSRCGPAPPARPMIESHAAGHALTAPLPSPYYLFQRPSPPDAAPPLRAAARRSTRCRTCGSASSARRASWRGRCGRCASSGRSCGCRSREGAAAAACALRRQRKFTASNAFCESE
jgi:hypothetical protein